MSSEVITMPRCRVSFRESLRTGSWRLNEYVDVVAMEEAASPAVSRATLIHRAGTILHPGEVEWTDRPALDLTGQFVKIEVIAPDSEEDEEPLKTVFMRVTGAVHDIGGDATEDIAQSFVQTFAAVGLEDLLAQTTVTGAFIHDRALDEEDGSTPTASRIMTPMVFNELGRVGLSTLGNRCKDPIEVPDLPEGLDGREAYAFEAIPRDNSGFEGVPVGARVYADVWSVADIVKYLFSFYVTDFDVSLMCVAYEEEGGEEVDPIATALSKITPVTLPAEGDSVKAVLDKLLSPARGFGWRPRPKPPADDEGGGEEEEGGEEDEDPVELELHIYSVHDADVELNGTTIPANTDTISINAARDSDVEAVRLSDDQSDVYDEVIVRGAPLLSCFTVSFADGTLEKDWTSAEETQYKNYHNPTYIPAEESEFFVDAPALAHVFCRYRIPYDWDGSAGDGAGGTKTLVLPKLGNDGELTAERAGLVRTRRTVESYLPILSADRPDDAEFEAAGDRLYRMMFTLLKFPNETGKTPARIFGYCHDMPQPRNGLSLINCDLSPSGKTHGIHLQRVYSHFMGNDAGWTIPDYDFIPGNGNAAIYAYTETVATVAIRTDELLFASRVTRSPGPGPTRRLYIDVPDAELWIIAPNTVTGLTVDGDLERYSGERKVRDDTPRLKTIARSAAAWYGKVRRAIAVDFRGIRSDISPGQFVQSVVTTGDDPINLCVSSVRYDFIAGRTSLVVARMPVDFSGAYR